MADGEKQVIDRFWTPSRVGAAYVLLFVLSIPWYLPSGYGEGLVAGFPLWCLLSLACYIAAAALTVVTIDIVWASEAAQAKDVHPIDAG